MNLRQSIKIMRILCPSAFVVALVLCALSVMRGLYTLALINAFLAGVNALLTDIQWRWFKL